MNIHMHILYVKQMKLNKKRLFFWAMFWFFHWALLGRFHWAHLGASLGPLLGLRPSSVPVVGHSLKHLLLPSFRPWALPLGSCWALGEPKGTVQIANNWWDAQVGMVRFACCSRNSCDGYYQRFPKSPQKVHGFSNRNSDSRYNLISVGKSNARKSTLEGVILLGGSCDGRL